MLTYSERDGKLRQKIRSLLRVCTDMDNFGIASVTIYCGWLTVTSVSRTSANGKSVVIFSRRCFFFISFVRSFHSTGFNCFHKFGYSWPKSQFLFFLLLNSLLFVNTAIQNPQKMNISYYYYPNDHNRNIAVKDVGQCSPVPASESICQFLHRSLPISSSFWYILRYYFW
jgi:hypothetical protein